MPSGISVIRQMHEGESPFSMPLNIPLPNKSHEEGDSSSGSETVGQRRVRNQPTSRLVSSVRASLSHALDTPSEHLKTPDESDLLLPSVSLSERSPLLRTNPNKNVETSLAGERLSELTGSVYRLQDSREWRPGRWMPWNTCIHKSKYDEVNTAQKGIMSGNSPHQRSCYDVALSCFVEPAKNLPAVILGILMNLLDGVSYGMVRVVWGDRVKEEFLLT